MLMKFGGLVVSVPDPESTVPGSNLGPFSDIISGNVNHKKLCPIYTRI